VRRRDFIKKGVVGTASLGAAGCSTFGGRKIQIERMNLQKGVPNEEYMADFSFDVTTPKPRGGTMLMGEIGKTGIKVSKFGFGSHMTQELLPFTEERKVMIREAYDLGVTFFDVYEKDWDVYQYEPMGRYLAPMINDVVISIVMIPYDGRSFEQEFERALRLFGRDYIDMVRISARSPESNNWNYWEKAFKLKEQGYIRALGIAMHHAEDADYIIENQPIDYVIFPYNFYHNLLHNGRFSSKYEPFGVKLRKKGIGIVTMKPFCTDWFIKPLIKAAQELDETGEISLPQAALRYIINSDLNPDATLGGMFNLNHVYENILAYYNTTMTKEEEKLLKKMRQVVRVTGADWLPDYYKFLNQWAPDTPDNHIMDNLV